MQQRYSSVLERLVETTGDDQASTLLFQQISVALQQFNSVLLYNSFIDDDRPEFTAKHFTSFKPPGSYPG